MIKQYPNHLKFANYHNPLYPSCTDNTEGSVIFLTYFRMIGLLLIRDCNIGLLFSILASLLLLLSIILIIESLLLRLKVINLNPTRQKESDMLEMAAGVFLKTLAQITTELHTLTISNTTNVNIPIISGKCVYSRSQENHIQLNTVQ